jgi:hypothetical protein
LRGATSRSLSLKAGLKVPQKTQNPSGTQGRSKVDVPDWLNDSDSDNGSQADNALGDSNSHGDLEKGGAEGDGDNDDSDVGGNHGNERDKTKDDDRDQDDDDGDDRQGEKPMTELDIYLKEKEERIAARKAMEESLAQEWGDLAKAFKKPSPKKRKPRQPKMIGEAPSRRSARTSQGNTADAPSNADPPSAHAPSLPQASAGSQKPLNMDSSSSSQELTGSQHEDRQSWPEWLRIAIDQLGDLNDSIWMGLVTKFIALEQQLGYPTGMVRL